MSIIRDIFTGIEIEVPRDVDELLVYNERVLCSVRQARTKQLITPDSIYITSQRIIIRRPTTLGLRRNVTDYRFRDIANVRMKKGIINSTIIMKVRFLSEDLCLESIPNKSASKIFKLIQEQMSSGERIRSEDPMEVLKVRYAKGEITWEQYQDMKRKLEGL